MITYNQLFNEKTLNIFTDASIRKTSKETIGAPGYVAVIGDNIVHKDIRILRESSNNESEIYAIYMALQYAILMKDKVQIINIFSDSQFAIYSLREWIFKWVNNIRDDVLYNSSNQPVANQSIILNIINNMLLYDLPISFYHNRGHFKQNQIREFIELFKKHNFLEDDIERSIGLKIMYYNNIVDNDTRNLLKSTSTYPTKLDILKYYARDNLDLNHYKKLLNI